MKRYINNFIDIFSKIVATLLILFYFAGILFFFYQLLTGGDLAYETFIVLVITPFFFIE